MEQPETYEIEGIEYTKSNNRMRYNPEFHENHGKPWTVSELAYMCSNYKSSSKADLAMALGRTEGTVLSKAHKLRKSGEFDKYRELGRTS